MKLSRGMAGIVIMLTDPRAPISMEIDDTVSLSGASRTVTKSSSAAVPQTASC